MKRAFVLVFLALFVVGCSQQTAQPTVEPTAHPTAAPTAIPEGFRSVDVNIIVAKMVERPSDRERDFTVVRLDGTYQVFYDPSKCMTDDRPYMYGPFDSISHCPIADKGTLEGIVSDFAWLDDDLAPLRAYTNCLNSWVYLGVDQEGRERWFIEMFGFRAFCEEAS